MKKSSIGRHNNCHYVILVGGSAGFATITLNYLLDKRKKEVLLDNKQDILIRIVSQKKQQEESNYDEYFF
jgi:hypothetical protein